MNRQSKIAGAAVLVAIAVWVAANIGMWLHALYSFPRRHSEAAGAINRIYAHFETNGAWPAEELVTSPDDGWLPPNWEYEMNREGESGVLLKLHGHFHANLHYRFSPPRDGVYSRRWEYFDEGGARSFQAEMAYSGDAVE